LRKSEVTSFNLIDGTIREGKPKSAWRNDKWQTGLDFTNVKSSRYPRDRCCQRRRYRMGFRMLDGAEHESSGALLEIGWLTRVALS
jgi:hypothetical protein